MSGIRFNWATKEIEIKGSDAFIGSYFHQIEELLKESQKIVKNTSAAKTKAYEETPASDEIQKSQPIKPERSVATKQGGQEVPEAQKATRPPVRKYFNTLGKHIRSEDTSVNKNQTVDLTGRTLEGISIASLKEKFGLSQQQIEGIIKDAEKHGRVRKYLNGSYVWV
jgi:hypothetical protein